MAGADASEIVAAIKFDRAAPAIVQAAQSLAAASGRRLRLVHVHSTEMPAYRFSHAEMSGSHVGPAPGMATYVPALGDHAAFPEESPDSVLPSWSSPLELAREQLMHLAATVTTVTQAPQCDVLVGEFPDTLLEHAAGLDAALVVTGAATKDPGFLRTKLRHTYKLMARTALPVLVLPDALSRFQVGGAPMRILVADDLTEASRAALKATETLIGIVGRSVDVLHVHVETMSGPDHLAASRHATVLARLKARAEPLASEVEAAGGSYRTELWHGRVGEELSRAAQVSGADVTVFGQHHFLKKEKLALGQMPFGAMLAIGSAVLVAPPAP